MSSTPDPSRTIGYQLKVRLVEQTCLFELAWGQGQQLSAELQYPRRLSVLYREWRFVYLSFYQNLNATEDLDSLDGGTHLIHPYQLRGRIADSGSIESPQPDWRANLVTVEAEFLSEFHNWLRSRELFEIRAELVRSQHRIGDQESIVDVLVTCGSIDLARLPWEAWEIGKEFDTNSRIRIFRTPPNIRWAPQTGKSTARILAILGDDTGLNFAKERKALAQCQKQIQVEFVGWQPGKSSQQLSAEIRSALRDPQGWDVLLFFGHSNETDLMGGVISIAPDAHLQMQEIAEDLQIAKEQGLQFALFNSCSGLSIADTLINLGLSQVVVMREAIHNHVAQEFLVQFLQSLADYHDAADSLRSACKFLKVEQNFTYPSAYLIPSLFRHPAAQVFRLQRKPSVLQRAIGLLRPNKVEAIALGLILFLSSYLPVHDYLVSWRILVQSFYRDFTDQIDPSAAVVPPPVLLVQIDEESIRKAKIAIPRPMDREFVAQIVQRLAELDAQTIGIDILFDRYGENPQDDLRLASALRNAVEQHQTELVVATSRDNGHWLTPLPEIADSRWSIQGDVELLKWAMKLAPRNLSISSPLPLSYVLAFSHRLNEDFSQDVPPPNWQSSGDRFSQLIQFVQTQTRKEYTSLLPPKARRRRITLFSRHLHQRWLQPIIDFSIPPDRAYQRISAWKLLEPNASLRELQAIDQQVVVLAAGGYGEAGLFKDGQDNFPVPLAVGYWRSQANPPDLREILTGGEAHAYMIHHLLRDQLVVPVPDLWMVGGAILLGKGMVLAVLLTGRPKRSIARPGVVLLPLIYGAVGLQAYISAALLFPFLLPCGAFWICAIPILLRKQKP
jgi:hypothetical protein